MSIPAKFLIGTLGALFCLACDAATEVGEVSFSRGVLTGQVDGEQTRLIGKGVSLHNGETLNTGSRGFALIELEDGTRMTLRPNTTFKIENVNTDEGEESAFLSLIRGGLRAITGLISKKSPNSFHIDTPVATIGIRGTEFDARLCEGDECQQEESASGHEAQRETRVVGRVALIRGKASGAEDGQSSRVLTTGAAVYERDQIQTGIKSYVVIAFNDQSRATLSPQSAFRIEEHEFKPEQPDENNSFFSFLKGGLRMVTGLVGRLNKESFRVATPTATIGIRGTGFDLVCEGTCVDSNAGLDPARDSLLGHMLSFFVRPAYALGSGNGMYAKVWRGQIVLQLGNGQMLLGNGRTAYLRDNFSTPKLISDIPAKLRIMGGAPRPDKVPWPEDAFIESDASKIEAGLYVNVRKGDVAVRGADGNIINIGAGEVVLAGQLGAKRLSFVPSFQKYDKFPFPNPVSGQERNRMNLFGAQRDGEGVVCTVR